MLSPGHARLADELCNARAAKCREASAERFARFRAEVKEEMAEKARKRGEIEKPKRGVKPVKRDLEKPSDELRSRAAELGQSAPAIVVSSQAHAIIFGR